MALGTRALAAGSARRPWRVVVIWTVLLAISIAITGALLGGALTTSVSFTNEPDSIVVSQLVEELRGEADHVEYVVVTHPEQTVGDPEYADYVTAVVTSVADLGPDVVETVGSYLDESGPVSPDGHTTLIPVAVAGADLDDVADNASEVQAVVETQRGDEFTTVVFGPQTVANDFNHIAEEDLAKGEMIGIAVALVVLVLVFGTIVSGLIPILLGMISIAVALGAAALVGQVFELSFFVTNMISMIGLAVGIDYSLFIVSRYREERAAGHEKQEAIERAGGTATRAVFFSGITVVFALVGMLILPNTIFRSLGTGAILVVIVAVMASMTLLPAVLSLMGNRIEWLRIRRKKTAEGGRWWDTITRAVMGRPVVSLVASAGVLLLFASSFLFIDTGFAGVSTLPDDIETKQGFLIVEEEFAGGFASPVEIAVRGDGAGQTAGELVEVVQADPRFGGAMIDPLSTDDIVLVSVLLPGDVNSVESLDAVRSLRADVAPAISDDNVEVFVGGETAITIDFTEQTDTYTPIVFAVVLGLSFILLLLAFRSIVVPAKAIVMNLLSVGAAYGLVVAFFQIGVGPEWVKDIASFFGFAQVEVIEDWIPLFLFSVLFGLSMDYHVFLLSRIKERFDITGDNTESVAYGLRTTGALITGAAAIMVAVFGGFAAGRLVTFQQMGFGLAVAVLLDATIVRSVLVPASMKLLGARNWYFPSWLEWIPNVSIEGHADDPMLVEVEERELQMV